MNNTAAARLYKAVQANNAPHAILLAGSAGSDAFQIAKTAVAFFLLGANAPEKLENCPDYFELGPLPVSVDAVRELQLKLYERAFSGRRAALFREAHNMNAYAQSALLKTIEEPPDHTMLFLEGQEAGLLPTIRSRCSILRIGYETQENIEKRLLEQGIDMRLAHFGAWLSDGAPNLALSFACEAYAAYADKAAALFLEAAHKKLPPFQAMAALLDESPADAEDGAKSKAARQRPAAELLLRVWMLLSADILYALHDKSMDEKHPLKRYLTAESFTIRGIQGIIEMLFQAKRRVQTANPSMAMDHLLTAMAAYDTGQ